MKIIVVEVEMNAWKTTYSVNLNSDAGLLGDGWTVDVVVEFFKGLLGDNK